jgi:hypothetical protein
MEMRKTQIYDLTWAQFFAVAVPHILASLSFYHSQLYDTNWGNAFGRVKHFTTSNERGAGGFKMAPSVGAKLSDGGCDVVMGFDDEELQHVKGDGPWNRYFRELGT